MCIFFLGGAIDMHYLIRIEGNGSSEVVHRTVDWAAICAQDNCILLHELNTDFVQINPDFI